MLLHPYAAGLIGGSLIGGSAALLLLLAGEILGASGLLHSLLFRNSIRDPNQHWKLVLLASFGLLSHLLFYDHYTDKDNGVAQLSKTALALGGTLVGFGTNLGNGCTSGHGICGLARLSKRSMVAVACFMASGILTAYLTQAATTPFDKSATAFLRDTSESMDRTQVGSAVVVLLLAFLALGAPTFHQDSCDANCRFKVAPAALAGVLFAVGLCVSQMVYPTVVFGFLNVGLMATGDWNPTLVFVMGGGCVISFLSYQFVEGHGVLRRLRPLSKPMLLRSGSNFCVPQQSVIDSKLIVGSICFGLGWGLTGLCPGPAMFLASVGATWVLACYWPAFFAGSFVAEIIKRCSQPSLETESSSNVDDDALIKSEHGSAKDVPSTEHFSVSNES